MSDDTKTIMLREIVTRYGKRTGEIRPRVCSSRDVNAFLRGLDFHSQTHESFIIVATDAKHRPVAWTEAARGGAFSCGVEPAALLRWMVLSGGVAMILAHNHPSGDPNPSEDDINLTVRLVAGARLLGIDVLDHVILGEETFYSFLDSGVMDVVQDRAKGLTEVVL